MRPPCCSTYTAFLLVTVALGAVAQAPVASAPRADVSTYDPSRLSGLRYRLIGPARGGRVTAVTGVDQEPLTFYFGSTGGGVWKTTDAGVTWRDMSAQAFGSSSIGALDVANSDPNIIYVGTGSEAIRSNVSIGKGIYKSTDAGKTWRFVGLRDAGQIGSINIHPTNPNIVFAAVVGNPFAHSKTRGIYRTKDGGATWENVLYLSDSTGAVDIELKPDDPNVIYASMWHGQRRPWTIISGGGEDGIFKSTDGGDHWTRLRNGLPTGVVGKSDLAVSAAAPDRVYALVEAKVGGGLYRSDDAGEHWTLMNTTPGLITRPFYYDNLDADPTNADVVYAGTEGFYKSVDGGKTFRVIRSPHSDNHDMWINPKNGNLFIQSNDGGANVTQNGGLTWSTQENQPTAEIYQVAVDNQYPYRVYGAQQDNTTLIVPSLPVGSNGLDDPIQSWRQGPGCETGPIIPNNTNPDTVYGGCKGQWSRMRLSNGQEQQYWIGGQSLYGNANQDLRYRFQRVSPMEVSPHEPHTVYYGSQYVHRTRDEGVTWETISPDLTANDPRYRAVYSGNPITVDATGEEMYATLYAIRESKLKAGLIWTGANDGPIHVTQDNGKTWTNVTPKDLPPGGRVQNIDPSPHRPGAAYVAVLRYLLGDFQPYIYKTENYGKTWTRLRTGNNGIPADYPTRVVREDPNRPGLLYAGTEFGMFVSFDDGAHWHPMQLNLPITPVTDIVVHRNDLVISTQGRSFWILDDITPLQQLTDAVALKPAHLFTPREAIRYRYRAGFGGAEADRTAADDAPQYPPAGAMIDYWRSSPGRVTLDILDAKGAVVRSFAADSGRVAGGGRSGSANPIAQAGLNRFIWDMTYPGPTGGGGGFGGRSGPMAAPGTFTVRLTANGTTYTQPLVLRADPRVLKDGITQADLERQLAFNLKLRDLVSEANKVADELRSAKRPDLDALFFTPPVRYSKPGLQAHITYLYSEQLSADQRVGRDAMQRYEELRQALISLTAAMRLGRPTGRAVAPPAVPPVATWTSAPPMIHARSAHAVVSNGTELFALGGTGAAGRPVLEVERFDGTRWTDVTTLPGNGLNAPAAAIVGRRIYVLGGFNTTTNVPSERVLVYDIDAATWSDGAPLPAPRGGHAAVVLEGKIHLLGGGNSRSTLADHSVYDPASNRWSEVAALPRSEGSPAAAVFRDRIYSIGGRSGPSDFGAVDIYDPASNQWTAGPAIEPRGTAGAVNYCGAIYLFGGESQARAATLSDVLRLGAGASGWTDEPRMPTARNFARAVPFGADVLVVGGSVLPGSSHESAGSAIVERFHEPSCRGTPPA